MAALPSGCVYVTMYPMTSEGPERGIIVTAAQDVAVQELREHLGDYLQRVAAGERFRVTEDGRPVALLSPLPEPMSVWDRLIAEGRLIPGKGNLLDLGPPTFYPSESGLTISEALEEQRAERLP